MPLPTLQPDSTPSEAELQTIMDQELLLVRNDVAGRDEVLRSYARIVWKMQRRAEDPNAFLVPFSTDPSAFESAGAYGAYRKGPVWKAQRTRVLELAGRQCVGCGARATQVHHRDYRPRVIAGEDDLPLVALCKSCHLHLHDNNACGREPSWQESEARLTALVARREQG
jgi:hypothetical protein